MTNTTDNKKPSYDYIRGLVEGEGTFTFSPATTSHGRVKIPEFIVRMHIRDKEMLENVRDSLGLTNKIYVYNYPGNDGAKRGPQAILIVREFGQLKNIIIPLFYKKLIGNKGRQFEAWLEKMGNDPEVPQTYKFLYKLHKAGFYDRNPKFIS